MNSIIIDDEPLAREGLQTALHKLQGITVIGSFNSARKAAQFMQANQVDLVFLDIQMPGMNGLEFAGSMQKETLVIFTTAYSQYAVDSYEVDALDYLVKPIREERLEKAVIKALAYQRLLQLHGTTERIEKDFMLIKAERRYHKVFFNNILYIEGLKDYVVIYTETGKIATAMNLKTVHGHLNAEIFSRVSKSYLVNLSHIDSFDKHTIYIRQAEVPIGDVYRKAFLETYLGKDLSEKL
jgi:DNA-binding LytR/AlgR family response regulator